MSVLLKALAGINRRNLVKNREYVIVSDFDGTIAIEDSNNLLSDIFGNEKNAENERAYTAGEIGLREAITKNFMQYNITFEEYHSFLKSNIHIDPTFYEFMGKIQKSGTDFFILSGGYKQTIEYLLGDKWLKNVAIYANELHIEDGYIRPRFAYNNHKCYEHFGPCGNCKRDCIDIIRRQSGSKIIFIGDGLTDRCAAKRADVVFAKEALEDFCKENNLPYIKFNNFIDILENLES